MADNAELEALAAGAVHVWCVREDEVVDERLLARYRAWLTEDEAERLSRLRFERHRHEFLLTRALVRSTLSRYRDLPPEAWRFVASEHGRPRLSPGLGDTPLSFNLSNTRGLVACAVAANAEIGVDVEDTTRDGQTVAIADRFFSAREVAALHALPSSEQRRRFFEYWTLKEAYIKARGLGLTVPLGGFTFELDEARPIRVAFEARLGDDARAWHFRLFAPTTRHLLAVALRRPGAEPRLELRFVLPG